MVSVDQLEVLLRTIPQYFLFAALALFIFGWMDKKSKLGMIAEVILVIIGFASLIVLLSGYIPSPTTEGLDEEHLRKVIKMLSLFVFNGLLSVASLIIRIVKKNQWNPLVITIVAIAVVIFFQSTNLSKIKFELNKPSTEIME